MFFLFFANFKTLHLPTFLKVFFGVCLHPLSVIGKALKYDRPLGASWAPFCPNSDPYS